MKIANVRGFLAIALLVFSAQASADTVRFQLDRIFDIDFDAFLTLSGPGIVGGAIRYEQEDAESVSLSADFGDGLIEFTLPETFYLDTLRQQSGNPNRYSISGAYIDLTETTTNPGVETAWRFEIGETFTIGDPFDNYVVFWNLSTNETYGSDVRTTYFSVVPVPAAVWLFASALGMLGWLRRRR